jgi:two-component sensor histidine kinase
MKISNISCNYFFITIKRQLIVAFLVFVNLVYAQKTATLNNSELLIHTVEDYILRQELDSAKIYLENNHKIEDLAYKKTLLRITNNTQTYSDFYNFALRIFKRNNSNFELFSHFVSAIPVPTSKKIELDYVFVKWLLISKLRDNANIDEASKKNNLLENYIHKFNEDSAARTKAMLLVNTHQIVVSLIEKNNIEGKKLCLESLQTATKLNDNTLRIIFLNLLCDFLIDERDLDGYIESSELSLSLEQNLKIKSPYFVETLEKLIDAYIFKGGYESRVKELLNTLYNNFDSRVYSFSLYANFLRVLDKRSPITSQIFNRFNVTSYLQFCEKIEDLGKGKTNDNKYYFILSQCSKLLQSKGFLNEAMAYNVKAEELTRKIYSEDLSNSLANYKVAQAIKQKELEIRYEKEKTNLYSIILALSAVVLLTLAFIIIRKFKQEQLLKAKNSKILLQKDAIQKKEKEKDLLLREVHHRVKNNFQIVSSLLELQTKDIEDKKALELANEGKNRIKSMALIHQKLYENNDNLVEFDAYIHLLVNELTTLYASNKVVKTSIKAINIKLDVDTAIPLGLIINELITNAYKYAFQKNKINKLTIEIYKQEGNFYKLIIADNGPGLTEITDLKKVKSLGLRLVTRLVKQLHGKIIQRNLDGAYFEIHFKDTNLRKKTY